MISWMPVCLHMFLSYRYVCISIKYGHTIVEKKVMSKMCPGIVYILDLN